MSLSSESYFVDSPPRRTGDQVACRWTSQRTDRTWCLCWFSPSQTRHRCERRGCASGRAESATSLQGGFRWLTEKKNFINQQIRFVRYHRTHFLITVFVIVWITVWAERNHFQTARHCIQTRWNTSWGIRFVTTASCKWRIKDEVNYGNCIKVLKSLIGINEKILSFWWFLD